MNNTQTPMWGVAMPYITMRALRHCDTQFVQTPSCLANGTTIYFTQPITVDISAVSSSWCGYQHQSALKSTLNLWVRVHDNAVANLIFFHKGHRLTCFLMGGHPTHLQTKGGGLCKIHCGAIREAWWGLHELCIAVVERAHHSVRHCYIPHWGLRAVHNS